MTDKEIIKALECCMPLYGSTECIECPFSADMCCKNSLKKEIIRFINKQQVEIERLKQEQVFAKAHYGELEWQHITLCEELKTARAEATKEFAEKVENKLGIPFMVNNQVVGIVLDETIEEMVGAE